MYLKRKGEIGKIIVSSFNKAATGTTVTPLGYVYCGF